MANATTMPAITHVAVTVTGRGASKAWYTKVQIWLFWSRAPLPPPAAWNSWMSASRGPDRLDDRRVWRAVVLQTCHYSALICGNF